MQRNTFFLSRESNIHIYKFSIAFKRWNHAK